MTLKDSGTREEYPTGAVRDNGGNKGRCDLFSVQALLRLSRLYQEGARKYSDRNWEKGINISRCVDAAFRHLLKYLAGCDDEDHLAAVLFNVSAIMFYEEKLPSMQDLPEWEGRTTKWIYELDKD